MNGDLWRMWEAGVPKDICNDICARAEKNFPVDDDVGTQLLFLTGDEYLTNLLYGFADEANQVAFGVNVFKRGEIQFTKQNPSVSQAADWHHDIDWHLSDGVIRKLSVLIQLSDPSEYTGGDFYFDECETPDEALKKQGSVLVYPSYLKHITTPVETGARRFLAAWFYGPKWQ